MVQHRRANSSGHLKDKGHIEDSMYIQYIGQRRQLVWQTSEGESICVKLEQPSVNRGGLQHHLSATYCTMQSRHLFPGNTFTHATLKALAWQPGGLMTHMSCPPQRLSRQVHTWDPPPIGQKWKGLLNERQIFFKNLKKVQLPLY